MALSMRVRKAKTTQYYKIKSQRPIIGKRGGITCRKISPDRQHVRFREQQAAMVGNGGYGNIQSTTISSKELALQRSERMVRSSNLTWVSSAVPSVNRAWSE